MRSTERIISGRITSVRPAAGVPSRLEIEISPGAAESSDEAPPVWCSAPTVSANGTPVALSENHVAAAEKYFIGRPVEIEVDPDGTIRGQLLWKRTGES